MKRVEFEKWWKECREKMKKDKRIYIRVSSQELETLKKQADKLGLGISAYIRMLVYQSKETSK